MDDARFDFLFGHIDLDGLDPLDDDDRALLVARAFPVTDDSIRRTVADTVRAVIAGQIVQDTPACVWVTAERLLAAGLDRFEVMRQLALVQYELIVAMLDDHSPYDEAVHEAALAELPYPATREIAAMLLALVGDEQGLDASALVERALALLGFRAGGVAERMVDRVFDGLGDPDGPLAVLAGDRTVAVDGLTEGIVLTHVLTPTESELQVLNGMVDLAAFGRRRDLRLADGRAVMAEPGLPLWTVAGDWLGGFSAGTELAVRVSEDGVVDLERIDRTPALDPELVARVRRAYDDELDGVELPVRVEEIVLDLLLEDRATFAVPRPPLAALLAAAGLEGRGDEVTHSAAIWRSADRIDRAQRLADALPDPELLRAASAYFACLDDATDGPAAARPDEAAVRSALAGVARAEVLDVVADELTESDHRIETDHEPGADSDTVAFVQWCTEIARRDPERAAAHYVACVVAERADDVLAAERHLQQAFLAAPQLAPVIERMGWYASDRGDAVVAARHWSDIEPEPAGLAVVTPFAVDPSRVLGRNEPCWCGSGRKFKQCHQRLVVRPPLADRVTWLARKAVDWLEHAAADARADVLECALARADDPDDPESVDAAFADPVVVDAALVEGGWFEEFLAQRGPLLPDDERELATTWLEVDRRLHDVREVSEDASGGRLILRDRVTGGEVEVRRLRRTARFTPGSLVWARVVPDGESHQFVGAVVPVAPEDEQAVLRIVEDPDPLALCEWVRDLRATSPAD